MEDIKNSQAYKDLEGVRYHSYSSYDQSSQYFKAFAKVGVLWLVLRELPLKNLFARCFIGGVFGFYLVSHNWKINPFILPDTPAFYYRSKYDQQVLDNYPLVNRYVSSQLIAKKNNPGLLEEELWYKQQFPSFYHHHFKNYRYTLRSRRVVQWDGTFNQPVLPYSSNNDRTGLVHNGTNEIIEPGPNGMW